LDGFDSKALRIHLMNDRQNSFISMLASVDSCCRARQADWSGCQPFVDSYAAFKALYDELPQVLNRQSDQSEGWTEYKRIRRDAVTPEAMRMARALEYYANINNNEELRADARTTPTMLQRMAEKAFVGHVTKLLSLVAAIDIAQLTPYGLSAAQVTTAGTLLSEFTAALGKPEHAATKAAAATKRLAAIVAEARSLLKRRMDLAAAMLQDDQPDFYLLYKNCREIVDPGSRTRSLQVVVRSAETGQLLPGADLIISPGDIRKKTGRSGMCYINRLQAGKYTIRLLHDKHQEYTGRFNVVNKERTVVEVEMVG
jgi:hypothetical protein